ncbi:retrotransposon protein, putative, ty1-copia subclass, partial [Tanacetum coccineum]
PIPVMPIPPAGQVLHLDVLATHAAWVKASKEIVGIMAEYELTSNREEFHREHDGRRPVCELLLSQNKEEYDSFVQNYNKHDMGKTVTELHAMLKLHEQTLPKKNVAPALHAIRAAELLKNKKLSQGASTLGIFTIELYTFPSKTLVYDTGCDTHICNTTQGLRGSGKLKPGALNLYVGDGHRVVVKAIGSFHLCLPSGLVLVLHNCHYAPFISRGIILVSRLYDDGFINRFKNNTISVSQNNVVYFSSIPRDDIFEIDLSNSNTNDSSMYAVSNKRAKLNLDSTLLWHCRLGHISKKRIEKKMARKPYSRQVERAKDLPVLIHTDVCGPFSTVSRQGASYFVTFTDDFSRYGYVYLLKHKHEVFETFKVFQKQAPKLSYLKVWGCEALVKRDTLTKPNKLEPISIKCVFIGYPKKTIGYSFYYPPENKVIVAQNAELFENSLITQEVSGSLNDLEIIQEEDTHPSKNTSLYYVKDDQEIDESQSDINPIRRSTRTRHAPDHLCLYIDVEEYELGILMNPLTTKLHC